MTLTIDTARDHIGHAVAYTPHLCAATEYGIITEVRPPYVFVRYGLDQTAKATRAGDLHLALPHVEVTP